MNTRRSRIIRSGKKRESQVLFCLIAFLAMTAAVVVNCRTPRISHEAMIRLGMASDLIEGHLRGRQGLVGSLRWAPLPTLLQLPLLSARELVQIFRGASRPSPDAASIWSSFRGLVETGLASCIISALAAAALGTFLNAWLRRCGIWAVSRYALIAAVLGSPKHVDALVGGSSALLFVFLVVALVCFLIHWLETLELRSLAYVGIVMGLLVLTRYQALVLGIATLGVLAVYLRTDRRGEAYCEGTVLTCAIPILYVILLWLIANWLIMGDFQFFLRGILPASMANGPLGEVLLEGCEWSLCLIPVTVAVAAWVAGQLPPHGWLSRRLVGSLGALAAAALLYVAYVPWRLPGDRPADPMTAELPEIVQYIEHAYPHSRIVVSGALGYDVMSHVRDPERFIHTMSYYMEDILKRTRGQRLYLLIPAPRGMGRWEDIDLTYPGIYEHGAPFTLLERAWSRWRLYRVVRTDLPS